MQKSDSMAPEYELDGHASSLIYAFKRGAKHLTDIFAYSKWTLPQKGSLLVDHVIISNCPSTFTNKRDCRCVNVAAKEKDACENLLNQLRIHVNAGRSILLATVCLPAGDLEH